MLQQQLNEEATSNDTEKTSEKSQAIQSHSKKPELMRTSAPEFHPLRTALGQGKDMKL